MNDLQIIKRINIICYPECGILEVNNDSDVQKIAAKRKKGLKSTIHFLSPFDFIQAESGFPGFLLVL
jgi:hypothetical protein